MKRLAVCMIMLCGMFAIPSSATAAVETATVVPSPNTSTTENNYLKDVDCPSAGYCVSVGYFQTSSGGHQTLIQIWDGTRWSISNSPSLGRNSYLRSVSCASPTFCVAVGNTYEQSTGIDQNLVLTWNGSDWSIARSPNTGSSKSNTLESVSCVSINWCAAVGFSRPNSSSHQTLALVMSNGIWTIVSSESPQTTRSIRLHDVSCVSITYCVGVGYFDFLRDLQMLTMVWNGLTWSIVPNNSVRLSGSQELLSVSCVSMSSCVSVGYQLVDSTERAVAAVWNGTSWVISSISDSVQNLGSRLRSVLCSGDGSCLAVGEISVAGGLKQPLIMESNAGVWTVSSSPADQASAGTELSAVDCNQAWSCFAVGSVATTGVSQTLIELLGLPSLKSNVPILALIVTVKIKTSLSTPKLTKSAGLVVPKGAKVSLTVSSKYKKVCKVVGTTVKTVGKGTCPVKVVVTTKTKKKTSKTVTIKVN